MPPFFEGGGLHRQYEREVFRESYCGLIIGSRHHNHQSPLYTSAHTPARTGRESGIFKVLSPVRFSDEIGPLPKLPAMMRRRAFLWT